MSTGNRSKERRNRPWAGSLEALEVRELMAIDLTAYPLPMILGSMPTSIAQGADGNLWFTESGASKIGRVSPTGVITEFALPTALGTTLDSITAGPDGKIWFTESSIDTSLQPVSKIGRIDSAGTVAEFAVPSGRSIASLTSGPDGNLWFTMNASIPGNDDGWVGKITTGGVITTYAAPANSGTLGDIARGSDGNLWFAEAGRNGSSLPAKIGRITPQGVTTEFAGPTPGALLGPLVAGPDGNVWFAEASYADGATTKISKITPTGQVSSFALPLDAANPTPQIGALSTGPDGNVWFVQSNRIGKITPAGVVTTANLPSTAGQALTMGPDGNLWYTTSDYATGRVGRATPAFEITEFPIAPSFTTDPAFGIGVMAGHITRANDGGLWFSTVSNNTIEIRRIDVDGNVTTFPVSPYFPTLGTGDFLHDLAAGTDGNVWFALSDIGGGGAIGRISPTGEVARFPLPAGAVPNALTAGPDGRIWVSVNADGTKGSLVRVDASGAVKPVAVPRGLTLAGPMSNGPGGRLWFSASRTKLVKGMSVTVGVVVSLDPSTGRSVQYTLPKAPSGRAIVLGNPAAALVKADDAPASTPGPADLGAKMLPPPQGQQYFQAQSMTAGPDGNLWITASSYGSARIIRMSPGGRMKSFDIPDGHQARDITAGPDGNLWFTRNLSYPPMPTVPYSPFGSREVGRITPKGAITIYPLSGEFGEASSITTGPDGKLWITDTATSRIAKFAPPPLFSASLDPRSVHGSLPNATNESRPTFNGVASSRARIEIYATSPTAGMIPLGRARADAQGAWTLRASRPLPDGSYQVYGGEVAPNGQFLKPPVLVAPVSDTSPLKVDTAGAKVSSYDFDSSGSVDRITLTISDSGAGFAVDETNPQFTPYLTDGSAYRIVGGRSKQPLNFTASVAPGSTDNLATVILTLADPLPSGPLSLTVYSSGIVDQAGNDLDGENRGRLPSGNGRPGGDFVVKLGTRSRS